MAAAFHSQLLGYWSTNPGSAAEWDAFKAVSRGQYQTLIGQVRGRLKADLVKAEEEAARLEERYILTKDLQDYSNLQEATGRVLLLRTSLTRKKLLLKSQRIFKQGEHTGRFLAWLECP